MSCIMMDFVNKFFHLKFRLEIYGGFHDRLDSTQLAPHQFPLTDYFASTLMHFRHIGDVWESKDMISSTNLYSQIFLCFFSGFIFQNGTGSNEI